jgi:hypothetical protein
MTHLNSAIVVWCCITIIKTNKMLIHIINASSLPKPSVDVPWRHWLPDIRSGQHQMAVHHGNEVMDPPIRAEDQQCKHSDRRKALPMRKTQSVDQGVQDMHWARVPYNALCQKLRVSPERVPDVPSDE